MTKHLVAAAAAVALCFVAGADQAEARGFHFQSGGVHVDVGRPHRGFNSGGFYGGRHVVGYGSRGYSRTIGYRGFAPSAFQHSRWHDTTHYDYHGPSLRRHGNHFDVVPGHYDLHRSGHWDRH